MPQGDADYQPVTVGKKGLVALEPHDVIVCRWPKPLRFQYFKNFMPDMPITLCIHCNKVTFSSVQITSVYKSTILGDGLKESGKTTHDRAKEVGDKESKEILYSHHVSYERR